jgi:ribulose-phosphate 3-epimerase
MMCADFGNLRGEVEALERAGADIFHMDLMDGQFVPNYGMGLGDIEYICRHATIPCDVHMMSLEPGDYVEKLASLGVSIIYVPPEADRNIARTLQKIIDSGAHAGIAINPGTAAVTVEPLLNLVDYVCVMTVNPGFAGQKYIGFVDEKIDELLALKDKYNYKVMIDGACSAEVIERLGAKGVEGFILGTSALFGKGRAYSEIMPLLRAL